MICRPFDLILLFSELINTELIKNESSNLNLLEESDYERMPFLKDLVADPTLTAVVL